MEPRVSVLLPAYDAEATLLSTLRSLMRQSEPRWECVLVDDGSNDQTLELARGVAAREPRLRVFSRPHLGISAALNFGLAECRAPFVARLDADDLAHRRRFERQLGALERAPQLAGLGCHVRIFPRRDLTAGLRSYESWLRAMGSSDDVAREAFIECPLPHPTLFMRRDALEELGYREVDWPEDYDLVLRALDRGLELGVVPERLLSWRDGPSRLSRVSERYALSAFVRCKAAFLARGFLAGGEGYILWGYGHTGKALSAELARHGRNPISIIELHPGRLGQLIRGVRVVPPEALPRLPRLKLVVSVAGIGPRTEIRSALARYGYTEGRDFVCAA